MKTTILKHLETGSEKTTDLFDLFGDDLTSDAQVAKAINELRREGLVRMVGVGDRSRWAAEDLARVEAAFDNDGGWMRVEAAE